MVPSGGMRAEIRVPNRGSNPTIFELASEFGWSRAALVDECAERPECLRLLKREGRDVAVLVTRRGPGELHLLGLAVEPRARRQGAARALVSDLIRRAKDAGDDWIHLDVRADNDAAIALYEKSGFRIVGRRHHYYRDGADALLMSLDVPRVIRTGERDEGVKQR